MEDFAHEWGDSFKLSFRFQSRKSNKAAVFFLALGESEEVLSLLDSPYARDYQQQHPLRWGIKYFIK